MMSKTHFWAVCDAVAYIKQHGNDEQKRALQTFEIAYGEKKPIQDLKPGASAVEQLVGFESLHTDKFGDLAFTFRAFPGGARDNVTGLGFHMFTAFNHFINPFPDTDSAWPDAGGYSYGTSSMKGFDSIVVKGISSLLHGVVDVDNSLVLDRIKCFWKDTPSDWDRNYHVEISGTRFAPWNVLSQIYYHHLLRNHYEPLEVRGPNKYIVGLQLLGPIVHSMADCCSVQHVRSTLGFGHSVWENYLKSKVYNREINVNARLVNDFLAGEPFSPSPVVSDGPLKGSLDIGRLTIALSAKTARRLEESTSQPWNKLWSAGDKFWRRYLMGTTMREDIFYLYNMAVAATVHCLVKGCEDLSREGILSPDQGLVNPEKMPDIERIQKEIPELPPKKEGPEAPPSEEMMSVPYSDPKDILGFNPTGKTDLPRLLSKATGLLSAAGSGKLETRKITDVFKDIEKSLVDQYRRMEKMTGDAFCPFRAVEKLPLDSDLSAHWGTGTFRPPSSEECDDPKLLERYIDLSDIHGYTAHKLQLTQLVAGLKFYRLKYSGQLEIVSALDHVTAELEKARGFGADDITAEAFDMSRLEAAAEEKEALARKQAAEAPGLAERMVSAVQDWLSPLFRIPVAALATAAAAVLLFVIVFPRGGALEPMMGLSSEKWNGPALVLMAPKGVKPGEVAEPKPAKPKLAIIVSFKDFKQPPSQELVESAYKALKPAFKVRKAYSVVNPVELKEAAEKGDINPKDIASTLDGLGKNLGVSKAVIVTVAARKNLFDVESEIKDLASGEVVKIKTEKGVTKEDLPKAVKESVEGYFK